MKHSTLKKFSLLFLGLFPALVSGCAGLSGASSSDDDATGGSTTTANLSDESDTEAAFTAAVDAVIDGAASTSSDGAGAATLTTSSYLVSGEAGYVLGAGPRFRCADADSYEQSFSCDNSDGSLERDVTFTDCFLENSEREVTLNGSFVNTVENGGDGFCNADDSFDFGKMVMGREEGDAVHRHETTGDGMIRTFENARGKTVTVTNTGEHTITYTDPVDEDEDGIAESVTATVERETHVLHTIESRTAHDVTIFTTDEDFVSTASADDETDDEAEETEDDEEIAALTVETDNAVEDDSDNATAEEDDAETADEESEDDAETTVEIGLPVHTLTFDDEGRLESRTIESGNLIVDHNLAQIRLVFGVGEDGLTFDDGTTCGPVSGSMTVTGYEINDDGTIGGVVGTGEVSFEDGEVQSAEFEGAELTIRPSPCH